MECETGKSNSIYLNGNIHIQLYVFIRLFPLIIVRILYLIQLLVIATFYRFNKVTMEFHVYVLFHKIKILLIKFIAIRLVTHRIK